MEKDIDEIVDNLEDIKNLNDKDLETLANTLYKLSCDIKSELYDVPEMVVEAGLLLTFRNKLNNEFNRIKKEKENLNRFIVDIYHILGLAKINGVEMMQIASIFRKEMKKRFKIKDKYKLLKILRKVINNNNNFFNEMDKELKKVYRKVEEFDNRAYIPETKLGKEIIDRFSKEDDDLRTGVSEETLKKLENSFN